MTKRRRGHFCWSCGRSRPNESFSGRGHARHVCRECSKLGRDELEYRQAIQNVDRALRSSYLLSRRDRAVLELHEPDLAGVFRELDNGNYLEPSNDEFEQVVNGWALSQSAE
jgi:hypothetical protein